MLKISTRGQYALLIMTDLAEENSDNYISLKSLSHRRNLSIKYLEHILVKLNKAGLVTGMRGNSGGYKLTKKPSECTAGEVLRAAEGDLSPKGKSKSNAFSSVGNTAFWKDFEDTVNTFADSVTLEQLAEKNRQFNGYDYYI